jgi:hypothetical protein
MTPKLSTITFVHMDLIQGLKAVLTAIAFFRTGGDLLLSYGGLPAGNCFSWKTWTRHSGARRPLLLVEAHVFTSRVFRIPFR